MNLYYELVATIDGELDVIFGSFNLDDVEQELRAEQDSLEDQGYENLHITVTGTSDEPDPEVYSQEEIDAMKSYKVNHEQIQF